MAPASEWLTWVILAGRGFGKTRSGAEWVIEKARTLPGSRGALVARIPGDARDVMVEGEAGILACSPLWFKPLYEPSKRRLTWPNGTVATIYSAEKYDDLRGPSHHWGWVDELCKYKFPQQTWDMFMMGLRLVYYMAGVSIEPQVCVTTTPRPIPTLKEILSDTSTVVTGGSTYDNWKNLSRKFRELLKRRYEGTRLGKQELYAQILEDTRGALWKTSQIEKLRVNDPGFLGRVAVAIDPSGSDDEDRANEVGLVVAARGRHDEHFYLLEDASDHYTPDGWGKKAVELYDHYKADIIVAEKNFGGQMVEHVVRTSAQSLKKSVNFKAVTASRGKDIRAEPIAALYEQGRAHHVGHYAELESELTTWIPRQSKWSPNRLDALVWAGTELMLDEPDELIYR